MNQHFTPEVEVTTPGNHDVVVKRKFNAPLALVWRCYTDPALVQRWMLGPPGWSMPVCEIDFRVGGQYLYRWRSDDDGSEFGFTGTYKEIIDQARIAHSEKPVDLDNMGDGEAHNVAEFTALGDMTEIVMTMSYASAEVRQMVLETGMTDGMGQTFLLLDALMDEMQG